MTAEFFEGPEKKFELLLAPGRPSLRSYPRERWEAIVHAARAQVLSVLSTDSLDSYLLSESSLFVGDDRLTMITCGRTRLVDAVEATLELIGGPEAVAFLVLERKNEHRPRAQPSSFEDDAARLGRLLPGRALSFGCADSHCVRLWHTTAPLEASGGDATLEVLMHGISAEAAALFTGEGCLEAARAAGVTAVLPGFEVDDYAFSPAGYSLNALRGGTYFTFHVTPEVIGSYVSFETNADHVEHPPAEVVQRVLEIFRPESFDVLSFASGHGSLDLSGLGYRLRKHVQGEVGPYSVDFEHYYQPPTGPVTAAEIPL